MSLSHSICSGLALWAARVLCSVTVLLLLTALFAATRPQRPTVRHGLWFGALLGTLALPLLIGAVDGLGWRPVLVPMSIRSDLLAALQGGPDRRAAFPPGPTRAEPVAEESIARSSKTRVALEAQSTVMNEPTDGSILSTQLDAPTAEHASPQGLALWSLALCAWALGSLFLVLRWTVGQWQLKRLLREAQAPPSNWRISELQHLRETLSLSELPPIRICRRARMPMVAGFRHPCVILPSVLANGMSPTEFTNTLLHECAHIRRRDQWVLSLQRLALLTFWPHPLFHYLNRQLEQAREELCDNYVLAASRPTAYAETLLRLSQVCLPAPKWGSIMGMLGRSSALETRIRRLLDKRRKRDLALTRWSRFGVALLMTLLTVGLAGMRMDLAAAPRPADPGTLGNLHPTNAAMNTQSPSHPDQIEQKVAELTRDWGRPELFDNEEIWAGQIHALAQIGRPAVPALIALLDQTEQDHPLRYLGFTLRAIGDPRAVPALIRAIPRTLRHDGSDCGFPLKEGELKQFMLEHDLSNPKERKHSALALGVEYGTTVDLGRPVREICAALQKITGTSLGEEEAYFPSLQGESHQMDLQRQFFDRIAHRWADWWGTNWNRFVTDPGLAAVALPALKLSGQPALRRFPTGPNVKLSSGYSNVGLHPVETASGGCFLDLDVIRFPTLPKALAESVRTGDQQAVWDWAAQEGVDLVAVTYRQPGADKDCYCLKAVGLQAWEVPNHRWYTITEEVRQELPLELGRSAGALLVHYDAEQGRYIPNRRATFLFITREGTPGILRLTTQVLPPGVPLAQEGASGSRDPQTVFGERYGLPKSTTDLNPNQEEEQGGFDWIGVKIEYRFFVSESGH